jgi:hypothetical protein
MDMPDTQHEHCLQELVQDQYQVYTLLKNASPCDLRANSKHTWSPDPESRYGWRATAKTKAAYDGIKPLYSLNGPEGVQQETDVEFLPMFVGSSLSAFVTPNPAQTTSIKNLLIESEDAPMEMDPPKDECCVKCRVCSLVCSGKHAEHRAEIEHPGANAGCEVIDEKIDPPPAHTTSIKHLSVDSEDASKEKGESKNECRVKCQLCSVVCSYKNFQRHADSKHPGETVGYEVTDEKSTGSHRFSIGNTVGVQFSSSENPAKKRKAIESIDFEPQQKIQRKIHEAGVVATDLACLLQSVPRSCWTHADLKDTLQIVQNQLPAFVALQEELEKTFDNAVEMSSK